MPQLKAFFYVVNLFLFFLLFFLGGELACNLCMLIDIHIFN